MVNKVIQRFISISHRKAELVCDLIRNKPVVEAIVILKNTNKKIAPIILKLLNSAIANATNNHAMNAEKLYVYSIVANEGPTLKRRMPRARGSADIIKKRTTHIVIELSDNPMQRKLDIAKMKEKKAKSKQAKSTKTSATKISKKEQSKKSSKKAENKEEK